MSSILKSPDTNNFFERLQSIKEGIIFSNPLDRIYSGVNEKNEQPTKLHKIAKSKVIFKKHCARTNTSSSIDLHEKPSTVRANTLFENYCERNVDEHLTLSSARFKKDIKDLEPDYCSRVLELLEPKIFKYIGQKEETCGLIAEEVEKIFPMAVVNDKDGNPFGIKYDTFIPLLVNVIKSQQENILQLQETLLQLQEKNSEIIDNTNACTDELSTMKTETSMTFGKYKQAIKDVHENMVLLQKSYDDKIKTIIDAFQSYDVFMRHKLNINE